MPSSSLEVSRVPGDYCNDLCSPADGHPIEYADVTDQKLLTSCSKFCELYEQLHLSQREYDELVETSMSHVHEIESYKIYIKSCEKVSEFLNKATRILAIMNHVNSDKYPGNSEVLDFITFANNEGFTDMLPRLGLTGNFSTDYYEKLTGYLLKCMEASSPATSCSADMSINEATAAECIKVFLAKHMRTFSNFMDVYCEVDKLLQFIRFLDEIVAISQPTNALVSASEIFDAIYAYLSVCSGGTISFPFGISRLSDFSFVLGFMFAAELHLKALSQWLLERSAAEPSDLLNEYTCKFRAGTAATVNNLIDAWLDDLHQSLDKMSVHSLLTVQLASSSFVKLPSAPVTLSQLIDEQMATIKQWDAIDYTVVCSTYKDLICNPYYTDNEASVSDWCIWVDCFLSSYFTPVALNVDTSKITLTHVDYKLANALWKLLEAAAIFKLMPINKYVARIISIRRAIYTRVVTELDNETVNYSKISFPWLLWFDEFLARLVEDESGAAVPSESVQVLSTVSSDVSAKLAGSLIKNQSSILHIYHENSMLSLREQLKLFDYRNAIKLLNQFATLYGVHVCVFFPLIVDHVRHVVNCVKSINELDELKLIIEPLRDYCAYQIFIVKGTDKSAAPAKSRVMLSDAVNKSSPHKDDAPAGSVSVQSFYLTDINLILVRKLFDKYTNLLSQVNDDLAMVVELSSHCSTDLSALTRLIAATHDSPSACSLEILRSVPKLTICNAKTIMKLCVNLHYKDRLSYDDLKLYYEAKLAAFEASFECND